ncbi:FG-GAP repeat domain-containing protein [Lederbergia citri]|uniref:VCBS repeat-containing protein n=1 Tax=Lederbergia citri TaxID=2833580 RepID=A0A942TD44_9BACI|nr:VCBS repeat-containing protein [Lederbergia citri]MBS4195475.1 VCBS repeat-containing protein [Lederbergia citri]
MKRYCMVIVSMVLLFTFSHISPVFAAKNPKTILEYHHDVTGDGQPEKITVYGTPLKDNKDYYYEVWAEVEGKGISKIQINYEGGFEPKLEFADLNHDGVDDILFSSATGGSGGIYNYALHTVKDGKIYEIPLPEPLSIESSFQNNFKAIMTIPGMKNPIHLDLSSRKEDYIKLGLYQKNGMLNEPNELMIDPIAYFKIVKIKGKEGYGLKSYRQVSGAVHADVIGIVEVRSYYENGKWNMIDVQWKPTKITR